MGQPGKRIGGRSPKVTIDRKKVSKENLFLPIWEQEASAKRCRWQAQDVKGKGSANGTQINCDTPCCRTLQVPRVSELSDGELWRVGNHKWLSPTAGVLWLLLRCSRVPVTSVEGWCGMWCMCLGGGSWRAGGHPSLAALWGDTDTWWEISW